jgi:hypothetical protein
VPRQQRARRYSESAPLRTRKQAAQGGQQRTIGGPVGGSSHLASKYCDFVAESEQFDPVGPFGAKGQYEQPKQLLDSEIDEGPQLPT